jgi:hypothetical protein
MMEKRNAYRILEESQKESDHYEELDVGGKTILKWLQSSRMALHGLNSSGSR